MTIDPSTVLPADVMNMVSNSSVDISLTCNKPFDQSDTRATLGIELSREFEPESVLMGNYFNTMHPDHWPLFK